MTGSAEALPDDEDAIEMLKRHIDELDPRVYAIAVSDNGNLKSVSADPKDDVT